MIPCSGTFWDAKKELTSLYAVKRYLKPPKQAYGVLIIYIPMKRTSTDNPELSLILIAFHHMLICIFDYVYWTEYVLQINFMELYVFIGTQGQPVNGLGRKMGLSVAALKSTFARENSRSWRHMLWASRPRPLPHSTLLWRNAPRPCVRAGTCHCWNSRLQ